MNILKISWLPFKLKDGTEQVLPMSAICRSDVIDFALPRADFQGAAYQFAIGLLQTVFAPEDDIEWIERYEQPPSEQELQAAFNKVEHAFNVEGDGPLFMQDYDELATAKPTTVAGLLIEAPGANGLKLNTDHFIKRGIGEVMSLEMASLALFTLQINAPSGGSGHRVGLRGGGPLTTLIMPATVDTNLWQKLWLNVINLEQWRYPAPDFTDGSVFPWLAKTQTSEKKAVKFIKRMSIHYTCFGLCQGAFA
ncbi:type I-E CRISPR-associated protein Cse1/CasA [Psychrosphaera sp. G1-22]|uniref:Type I-E CRISPR-associated protein Cse1/CasA n=1 Tax=Psychrosphaera algicola TaxID=3023714 RepID=A0ABT5FD68_9GAMM|nr:type I-E CRISPR-associated protein Cse1/CasA [Psychrosphaera sp. G1-22]MDC2888531.1 type I-E CRISPR-associated protein Cse1/CasA [Psychrosphaera sp. G1-22]